MKRNSLLSLLLVFVMLFGVVLTACGGDGGESETAKATETEAATEPAESGTEPAQTEPETEPAQTEPAETEPASETEAESETEPSPIEIDVSALKFEDRTVDFTGERFAVTVSGLETLPEGVTVAYAHNEATIAGTYEATATFTVPEGYAPIPKMTATLVINKPTVVDGPYRYADEDKTFLYSVNATYSVSSLALPDGITRLADYAVYGLKNLSAIYVPASVTEIGEYAIGYKAKYGSPAVNKNFTVYGEAGSVAEAYCKERGITFQTGSPIVTIANVDDLYVTDGAVLLLDAFDPANGTVDFTTGKWTSKLDNTKFATLHTGSGLSWIAREKGIGYNVTPEQYNAKNEKRKCYLDLGEYAVDALGNFTIEFVGAMLGIFDGETVTPCTDTNYDTSASTNRYGAWADWIFNLDNLRASGGAVRTSYVCNDGYTDHYGHNAYLGAGGFTGYSDRVIKAFSHVVTSDEKTTALNTYMNGLIARSHSIVYGQSVNAKSETYVRADANTAKAFYLMRGTACTLLAVRVYDRALSETEIARNHLADLCIYYGLELPASLTVFAEDVDSLATTFATFGFTDGEKDNLQNALNKALTPTYTPEED